MYLEESYLGIYSGPRRISTTYMPRYYSSSGDELPEGLPDVFYDNLEIGSRQFLKGRPGHSDSSCGKKTQRRKIIYPEVQQPKNLTGLEELIIPSRKK